MTPDERQLISDLFNRMRANGAVEKDRDAESLINQSARQTPDAAYLLVQSVLAQEHYLQEAAARIQELEAQNRELEDQLVEMQQAQSSQRSSGGSFLGGIFGGSRQPEPTPARTTGSVPAFGQRPASAGGSYGRPGSPWGQQPAQRGAAGGFGQPAYGQQGGAVPAQPPAQSGGPSFMRSAMTTAAGVAGGMLAANAISGMLRGDSSAHASGHNLPSSSDTGSSPFAVNNAADQQRELDEQQDLAQDNELDQEQVASYEDDDDSGDWGGGDDSEI